MNNRKLAAWRAGAVSGAACLALGVFFALFANTTDAGTGNAADGESPVAGIVVTGPARTGTSLVSGTALINEIVVNPNGTDDNCEYIEFSGAPSQPLTGLYFISVEGDSSSTTGQADFVADLTAGVLGTNGLLVIAGEDAGACTGRDYGSPSGTIVFRTSILGGAGGLENGTNSWILVHSPTTPIAPGTDLDTNDDGTIDGLPGDAAVIDGIGFTDGGAGDRVYGTLLANTAGGTPDMATRFPGNIVGNSADAWYWGDMGPDSTSGPASLEYDLGQVSDNFPSGGILTPGLPNAGAAVPPNAEFDVNGDGKTDFGVIRALPPLAGNPAQIEWLVSESGSGSSLGFLWGLGNDQFIPEDFDGDGKDDIAVWRQGPPDVAGYYIIQSSDGTFRFEAFGQFGDDATVTGDYDGDGKADPAVFRRNNAIPVGGNIQAFFYFRGSNNNPNGDITFVPWGASGDLPYAGDFDGDGKFDFCVRRGVETVTGPGGTTFILLRSSDSGIEYVPWGSSTDYAAPGDYDGDGKTDFAVARDAGGPLHWYILERDGGGTGGSPIPWGLNTDQIATGDFDGDGSVDIGIWRPATGTYWIRQSGTLSALVFQWGANGDSTIPGWRADSVLPPVLAEKR